MTLPTSVGIPLRGGFTSKELDPTTSLYYFGARYYSAWAGRWMSVDPLAKKYPGWSPYNYVRDNPATSIDPNGAQVKPKQYYNPNTNLTLPPLTLADHSESNPASISANGFATSPNPNGSGDKYLGPLNLTDVKNETPSLVAHKVIESVVVAASGDELAGWVAGEVGSIFVPTSSVATGESLYPQSSKPVIVKSLGPNAPDATKTSARSSVGNSTAKSSNKEYYSPGNFQQKQ